MKRIAYGFAVMFMSAVLVVLAPLASAVSPEDAFLRELQHDHVSLGDDGSDLDLGHQVCNELGHGTSPSSAKRQITASAPDLEGVGASIFLDASVTYLCPAYMDLPSVGLPPNMRHGYS